MMCKKNLKRKVIRHNRIELVKGLTFHAGYEDQWDEIIEKQMKVEGCVNSKDSHTNCRPQKDKFMDRADDTISTELAEEDSWYRGNKASMLHLNAEMLRLVRKNYEKGKKLWDIVHEKKAERNAVRLNIRRQRRKRHRERKRTRDIGEATIDIRNKMMA